LLLVSSLLFLVACAPAAPSRPVAPAGPAEQPAAAPASQSTEAPAAADKRNVTLRLAWFARGYDAPFFLALARGYYDAAGLNVEIKEGQGSVRTLALVEGGHEAFGSLDAAVLLAGADKGIQAKMVFMFNQRSPNALIHFADTAIGRPQDLRGKSIGTTPGANVTLLLPLYLDRVGVPNDAVTVVNVDAAGKVAAFRSRNFDLMTGLLNDQVGELEAQGEAIRSIGFADAGVNTVSLGVAARSDFIRDNPDVVAQFVAATQRAWDAAVENPDEAVAVLAQTFPSYSPTAFKSQFLASIPLLRTRNTEGRPTGWMAREDWEETNALLLRSEIIKQSANVEDRYTNEFIPSGR
jgi:NitT/TauT family transport system substrate-binding protein